MGDVADRGTAKEAGDRRMESLKARTAPQTETDDVCLEIRPSYKAGLHEGKRLMGLTLNRAAKQGDVNAFIDALEEVAIEEGLTLSDIFDMVSPTGSSCCHLAASFGKVETVELMVRHFPVLIRRKDFNGDTALHHAARAGRWEIIEVLLKVDQKDVDNSPAAEEPLLRIKNDKENTALHEALVHSQAKVAQSLIEKDPEGAFCLNAKRESPLSLSVKSGSKECVALILSKTEELERIIHDQNKAGKSPMHEAISYRKTGVLEVLLSTEPRFLQFKDEKGRFPLHYAAWIGYVDEALKILEHFPINAIEKDEKGLLPVHWASMMGKVDVVKVLLLYWPHLKELLDPEGRSILHCMAQSGQSAALKFFLKDRQFGGFEELINMKDKKGNTPLHLAAMKFHSSTVNRLIWDTRVDLKALNDEGMTALDAAKERAGEAPTWEQRLTLGALRAARVPRVHREATAIPLEENKSKFYRDRVSNLLIVSTLIATITFAAGFTLPGGYNNSEPDLGMATMLQEKKFQVFILCDTVAMYCSIIVAVALMWAQFGNELEMGRAALRFSLPILGIALGMLSLSFMAGISVVVGKLRWLDLTILIMGVTFTCIASGIFFPLWFPSTSIRKLHCIHYNPIVLPLNGDSEQKGCCGNLC